MRILWGLGIFESHLKDSKFYLFFLEGCIQFMQLPQYLRIWSFLIFIYARLCRFPKQFQIVIMKAFLNFLMIRYSFFVIPKFKDKILPLPITGPYVKKTWYYGHHSQEIGCVSAASIVSLPILIAGLVSGTYIFMCFYFCCSQICWSLRTVIEK